MTAFPPPAQPGWAWFLDVDGTLADFHDVPDRVTIHSDVRRILQTLQQCSGGAVALVSGRPIRDIDRLFGGSIIAVAGQHGNERRSALGAITCGATRDERIERAVEELRAFAVHVPQLIVEDKGISAAMHYRGAPELESLVDSVVEDVHSRMGSGFFIQGGKMLREIVPVSGDKGTAVTAFMNEAPFKGRSPAFVGDDVTDEHAFMVVNRLGGHSIKVGPGETIARHRLESVEAVRTWLGAIHAGTPRAQAANA